MLLLTLGGCQSLVVNPCRIDESLITDIELGMAPAKPVNLDLAGALKDIRYEVVVDNKKKQNLRDQLRECQK